MIYQLKIKFELNPIPKYIKFESELNLQELLEKINEVQGQINVTNIKNELYSFYLPEIKYYRIKLVKQYADLK